MAIKDVISWFYGKSKAETGKGNAPTQTGAQPRVNLNGPSVTIDGPSNQRMGRISIDGRTVAGMPFRTSGEDDRLIGNYVLISKDEIERATHEAKKEDDKTTRGLKLSLAPKMGGKQQQGRNDHGDCAFDWLDRWRVGGAWCC